MNWSPESGDVVEGIRCWPRHVAVIMDGNRRWARRRELDVRAGHAEGLERALALLRWCRDKPIDCVTLFAFASANWARQPTEVRHLMRLAMRAVRRFTPEAQAQGIRLSFIGRRDRLPGGLLELMERAERRTRDGRRQLRIAIDYSSQYAIAEVLAKVTSNATAETLAARLDDQLGAVDLLIRTGGDQRLSDFLLWECANAELYFPGCLWPDFDETAWRAALAWYASRERRFGR